MKRNIQFQINIDFINDGEEAFEDLNAFEAYLNKRAKRFLDSFEEGAVYEVKRRKGPALPR